ncbi:SdrD B-like domain-containing protein [Spirosoma taeanense]|uniref:SdrD B-like domain-containing protein n=1 Tax=Spirosoma taeanense TaxID=2735870 RepID=UPI001F049FCD|nr:SdrD B-like domain-containing protein [Spirosoma taeanense]
MAAGKPIIAAWTLLTVLLTGLTIGTSQAQTTPTIDLSVRKLVSNQKPAIGDVISYTVIVKNDAGAAATATNVIIKDELPAAGAEYVPASAATLRGTGTYTSGTWSVSAIAPGDSAVLTLNAKVLARGVWFNTAEVISASQTDKDSQPNNQSLAEDDYDAVCFSVPIFWYPGDEFLVSIPTGYNKIIWFRNNKDVTTVSADSALINPDSSLTIKSPGVYRFTTYRNGCPALNCCDIEVIRGLYGSLGDYVFLDTNKDGIQNDGNTGLNGVRVYLYDETGTTKLDSTFTAGGGKFLFDSLTDGKYKVRFIVPDSLSITQKDAASTPVDAVDSDAGPDGFTRVYQVDTSKPESDTARNNLNVDAGFVDTRASLGDLVFVDINGNGIQDGGSETGVASVKVTLYQSSTVAGGTPTLIASATTSATGAYSFTSLTPGDGYYVVFDTTGLQSRGYVLTQPNATTNTALDSDAGADGKTTKTYSLSAGENNTSVDAGLKLLSASLGDLVFLDNDGNGQQGGAGEVGVAGVKVTLYKEGQTSPVDSQTTNSNGGYLFTNLTPGVGYYVVFDTTGLRGRGYALTGANQGDDATDSDADGVTGRTGSYTLSPGLVNLTVDAGLKLLCPTNFNLVASNDAGLCYGDSIKLVASTTVAGAKVCWYLTPYDGTAFATVNSGEAITVKPTTTTVYYAEATTDDGCRSARKPVVVTVTVVQTPICLGNIKNTCPERTVDLTKIAIENKSPGLTYEWYTSALRSEATKVTNLTAVGAGKFYLFARSAEGCYSSPTVLTVEIVDCNCQNVAGVNIGPGLSACSGEAVVLKATLTGSATSVIWSSSAGGTFSSPNSLTTTFTPSEAAVTSGSALITATTNDPDGPGGVCSAATSSLILKINQRPDAPVGVACDDTIVCQGNSTKLIGFAPGGKINWYDQDNKLLSTVESGSKLVVKPSKAGMNTYYAEAVNADGCTSATRTSVTLTVGTCLADLAVLKKVVTPGPYSVGQTITYAITVSNKGKTTATSVKVSELLPPTLTYISATPAGEYSAGAGAWSVGSLTVGSDRNLLVQATINAAGTIKNTAVVSSPENDPNYAQDDTSSVTIQTLACDVKPPFITCAITDICKGDETVLKATGCAGGTVKWSDGQTGLTVTVKPELTTVYSASCITSAACTSAASNLITVTVRNPKAPTLIASTDNVCPGGQVVLTASGCEGGTYQWSESDKTGASITVSPLTKTTYTVQCRMANCVSDAATKTIGVGGTMPTPIITCSTTIVCPGEHVTLTVNNCQGTPVWSSTSETTTNIIVTPTLGDNSYTVYCKNGACTSPVSKAYVISVVEPVIPTVTASVDTICAKGKVVLTATGCNGTVIWGGDEKLTGSSIMVYPEASISYYAQCKFRSCLSNPSESVAITVVTPSAPINTTLPKVVCSGEKVILSAEGCEGGTINWSGTEKTGASVEIIPTETREYYATCKMGSCESNASQKIRITVNTSGKAPTIVASTTAVCNGGVVSLTATGCAGTVVWSVPGLTGSVVSVTASPTSNEYYAICKVGAQCGSGKSNVIKVNVTPMPTPVITASADSICAGETVTLTVNNCQGTPVWNTKETARSIIVSPDVTTAYSVFCKDGVCASDTAKKYPITVVPVPVPTIAASATAVEPGGTITLTATGCPGDVYWSVNDVNGNNKGASIFVRPQGTETYYAQCKFRSCVSAPSVSITVNKEGNCVAKAATLVAVSGTVCADTNKTILIGATPNGGLVKPEGYSVLYVLTKGAEQVIQQTSATPSFNVSALTADYTIHTLVYSASPTDKNYLDLAVVKPGLTTSADVIKLIADRKVCADLDLIGAKVIVRYVEPPKLVAGPSLTVCAGTKVTLTALGCEGGIVKWSDNSVGQSIEKIISSDLWLMATCTVDGCTSAPSHSVDIILGTPGIPTVACNKPTICANESVTLTATGCEGGTLVWSDNQTKGSILTVTPPASVSYRVKCVIGTCESAWSAYCPIKVGSLVAPIVSIAGSTTITSTTACFGAPVTLVAQGCPANSQVVWSNEQVGQSITVTPVNSVTYTARCYSSSTCISQPSNKVVVTMLPKISQPSVVDKTNTCPFNTVDLTTAVTSKATVSGSVFEFYTAESLSDVSKVTNPAAVGTSTYYVVEKTVNGCSSLPAVIHVQINRCDQQIACDPQNPATANAGPDATICTAKTYQLQGKMGGAGKVLYWTTSGKGTFDNPYLPNATYTASVEDIVAGKVTLTLSVSANNASCPVAKDEMVLIVEGIKTIPTIQVVGASSLCYGDSVTLKAPAGAASYKWSNNATTQSIVVKTSGSYTVQLFDSKGCSSVKSDPVAVNVAEPIPAPLVTNLRNTCPAVIANLTSALSATTAGSTYEYRIGAAVTSNTLVRPDSVGAGTYYVFAKNSLGCVSAPAKVVVRIVNCTADSVATDVSIRKTADKPVVRRGETVTYTITVSNQGAHTAHNIDVRDVLPGGLELVLGPAPNYSLSGGVITKHIDSLPVGKSETIVFSAHMLTKGEVINKAEITYLDQKDTDLSNNTSSVTVRDTSSYKPSLVGLAKAVVGRPAVKGDSLITVRYGFVLTNFGDDTLRKVQVTDDLAYAFAPNSVQKVAISTTDDDFSLKRNSGFTGIGSNTNLFDSTSYVAPGRSQTFFLDVTIRRAAGDTTRSFRNIAGASAYSNGMKVEDLSADGGDADPDGDGDPTNNTGFSSFTLSTGQPAGPSLGVALAVIKVEKQGNNSYNVTYKATIKNFGDVDLYGISLTDSLAKAFPTSFTVVGPPIVGAGSTLVPNASFNGLTNVNVLTNASSLAAGVQDTVLVTVNIKPNGNNGPFFVNVIGTGHTADTTQFVRDISNAGFDPTPEGSVSTAVRFDLPAGLIGVAKSVGPPMKVAEGVFDVPYTIKLTNRGTVPLRKVQVVDNLSETFGHGALIVSERIRVYASAGLMTDTLYTGQGLVTRMLVDSMSTLAVGASSSLNFVVRVNVKNADSLRFVNTAVATALTANNQVVEDRSAAGINDDPDHDLDPRNNSIATPVTLDNLSTIPYIGVAMAVRDTVRQADGSFNVTYQIVVRNYGTEPLTHVALSDSLSKVFNNQTGATYAVVKAPITTSTGSALKLNDKFNGSTDVRIVLGDSTSRLAVGKVDTILVVVNVATNGSTTTFLNTVYAQAIARTGSVSDISTNGLVPDLNGNNNPTDQNEREATPLNLPATSTTIFIPQGFSPNGDGINDLFVIRGMAGLTVSLEVYNRWGHLVYKNDDYQNDWDGKPNAGVLVGSDANGLPDGTYYYVITTSDGRKFVRYMTINR